MSISIEPVSFGGALPCNDFDLANCLITDVEIAIDVFPTADVS